MKKLMQRKGMVALAAIVAALFFLAGHFAWDGVTHAGRGAWLFGGDQPGTDGAISTDEHLDTVSELQYKRQCYATAGIFFALGAVPLWALIKGWNEKDGYETVKPKAAAA